MKVNNVWLSACAAVCAIAVAACSSGGGGDDNQPPTASFATWDYTVTGAEIAAVNGNYTRNGDYSTRPRYDHPSSGYILHAFFAFEDFRYWAINDGLLPDDKSTSVFDARYYNTETAATPPGSPWYTGTTGTGSAPEVLRMPISGNITAPNEELTAHYIFSDPDGDTEGATMFQWFRDGSAIPLETSVTYTTSNPVDSGSSLQVRVTPVDSRGLAGTPVMSNAVDMEF